MRDETIFAIETLAERWECSQAEVIERVINETPIPPRAGTVNLPRMGEGQSHWEIQGIGRGVPTDDPDEFVIVPIDET